MTEPFGLYCASGKGVYYTADFTLSGAITWSLLTTTGLGSLTMDWFAVDPFDPLNRQYVTCNAGYYAWMDADSVYARNGGNWYEIININEMAATSGDGIDFGISKLRCIWCDPTVEGSIYAGYSTGGLKHYIFKSLNYGSSWTYFEVDKQVSPISEFEIYGNNVWVAETGDWLYYSPDQGTNWYHRAVFIASNGGVIINPSDPTEAYTSYKDTPSPPNKELWYHKYAAGTVTTTIKQATSLLADSVLIGNTGTMHCMWIDPDDENHQRIMKANGRLYHTHDKWANATNIDVSAVITANSMSHVTYIQNSTGAERDVVVLSRIGGAPGQYLFIIDDENDSTPTDRGGIIDGTPVRHGVWVGYSPVNAGVYVYADEQGDITDIPDADNLGLPLFGDRSSWRDFDADTDGNGTPLADYHAQDIQEDTPQRHAPWPASSGQAPVSDGTKWVPTDIITQAEFDYSFYVGGHCPVTLDADAALILDLQGGCTPAQEIGLDVQQPTYVFIGPSFMPPDEPTFRPMYIEELANVTTTAPVLDGEVLTFDGGTGQWVNEEPSATRLRTVTTLTAGNYTLDDTYDVVVLDATAGDIEVTLPQVSANDGLEYAFKRIDDSGYMVSILVFDSVLLDSDGEILTDSDGEILTDSDGGAGDTIDGDTVQYLDSQYLAIQIVADADNSAWWII